MKLSGKVGKLVKTKRKIQTPGTLKFLSSDFSLPGLIYASWQGVGPGVAMIDRHKTILGLTA